MPIAHTTIVFMRYMFLAYQCRMETDYRTFGDLFYGGCLFRCNHERRVAVCWLVKEQIGDRLNPVPKVE
jgi:hypothetical protein